MKKINRRLLIYFIQFKRRVFVISNDHKNLTTRFEVTDDNIRSLSTAELKAIGIINSCIYNEQLDCAQAYIDKLYALYPFSTIINRMRTLEINDLRLGNKKLGKQPLPSIIDKDLIELNKSDIRSVNKYLSFFKNYSYEI